MVGQVSTYRERKKRQVETCPTEKPTATAVLSGGLRFAAPTPPKEDRPKPPKVKTPRVKQKNDPKLVAAARELRDRWLEEVNAGRYLPAAECKYAVERQLPVNQVKLIAA